MDGELRQSSIGNSNNRPAARGGERATRPVPTRSARGGLGGGAATPARPPEAEKAVARVRVRAGVA